MTALVRWIQAGESGSVVGLPGAGKSNLLGYLCHRPRVLREALPAEAPPAAAVWVDLNSLPAAGPAEIEPTLYRVVLRALYEAGDQLASIDVSLSDRASSTFRRVEAERDPFVTQSALRETLLAFEELGARLALVLDPFDAFYHAAPVGMLDSLRGLRDSFKSTLSYIVGLRHELSVVRDPMEVGELFEILDTHRCWVGAMESGDARWVIRQVAEATGRPFTQDEAEQLVILSGGYPALLRAAASWLVVHGPPPGDEVWLEHLSSDRSIQHRLEKMWEGLGGEEQRAVAVLHAVQSGEPAAHPSLEELDRLTVLGICAQRGGSWRIRSPLLASYVGTTRGESDRTVWLDRTTGELRLGETLLTDLTPLERQLLCFLVEHPLVRHTKTDLILNAWPDDPDPLRRTDDSVYQAIRGLRTKIEPNPSKPRYIVTWRGSSGGEGSYQFYPQGR
jgi:hypothetical protein